jgi:dihydroorotase-like cyclic amidohydrolase
MLRAMAASLYIVVEGEDPGFDIFVNGHALARNEDALERLAESLHAAPLLQFFSADENSMCLLLEQGAGDPEWARNLPEPQWFGSETMPVLNELREYERVLEKAERYKVRWHLAVSWR